MFLMRFFRAGKLVIKVKAESKKRKAIGSAKLSVLSLKLFA